MMVLFSFYCLSLCPSLCLKTTMAHKGLAAKKKKRCKQKTIAANKKVNAANKKVNAANKKVIAANKKK